LHLPKLFYRKQPGAFYWHEYLPETQTLYIQYNKCANAPDNAFEDFAKEVFASADSHPIGRVIVDLRFNTGGDSSIVEPLVTGLKSRPALIAKGRLCVLIGGSTFSSGLMAALDFRENCNAALVGEETGGKPNSYGEVKSLTLPYSKLVVFYSVKYFERGSNLDSPSLYPDFVVRPSLNDFLAGHDPVLEAALSRRF
jgi:C-terminal processing protease CtpA/Prc